MSRIILYSVELLPEVQQNDQEITAILSGSCNEIEE